MALENLISQDLVRGLFTYDAASGVLTRRRNGKRAGTRHSSGYRQVNVVGKLYQEHNIIWLYVTGSFPALVLDHKDRVRDNNRWLNLREVTNSQNSCNITKNTRNKSGLRNVSWASREGKWRVQIVVEGRFVHVGYYVDRDRAEAAAKAAKLKYHGDIAKN